MRVSDGRKSRPTIEATCLYCRAAFIKFGNSKTRFTASLTKSEIKEQTVDSFNL